MRIALLSSEFPPFRGGIATYAAELAAAATAAGHTVTVLAPDYRADQGPHDAALPFAVRRYPGGPAGMAGLPARIARVRSLLAEDRFDVVHAADWPFFLPVHLSHRRGARAIMTVHGSEIDYMRAARRRAVLSAVRFWRARDVRWIANSRYTADLLAANFPVAREHIAAVPLGVSADWIAGQIPRAAARAQYGVATEERIIVSVGRLVPRKGHLDLAAALATLPEPIARAVRWWIIGEAEDAAYAAELRARTAALAVHTEMLGACSRAELQSRVSAADLFCLPGYRDGNGRVEGFGLVFLEAAAYSVPAVATRSGGIPDAVIDGTTGLLVAERDVPALGTALVTLLGDDARRSRLAEGARRHAVAASWHAVMAATYD